MAFHSRKLLSDKKPDDISNCYICYVCPEKCSDYFPTPPLPSLDIIPPPPSKTHHMSMYLIIMLSVLGAALLLLFYLTIHRYRSRTWRRRRRNDPNSLNIENDRFREDFLEGPVVDHPIWYIRTVGLPQSVIDSIAVFTYKKGEGLIEGNDCSVCLNEFQENERLRLLPKCSHAFHLPCIDTWLRSHKNCPVCRAPVLATNLNAVPMVDMGTGLERPGSREEIRVENEPGPELETDESRGMNLIGNDNGLMVPVGGDHRLAEMLRNFDRRNGKFRVMSDLADRRVRIDRELKAIRRTVSMDFDSGCRRKEEGCSERNLGKSNLDLIEKRGSVSLYRLIKSSSHGRSVLQIKGPVSMKRSFSFSGKRSFRKHSRSQDSVQITELRLQN